jgi:DNA repair photolyase
MPDASNSSIQGRGAAHNPGNRFERAAHVPDPDAPPMLAGDPDDEPLDPRTRLPLTQYLPDRTQTILASNNSPDITFARSINPYRGCSHGCIYCYARPTHEYLGMSAGLDFETKILVKHDAAALLREELAAKNWKPQLIAMSGVTDCYQPVERKLRITRACLEVLLEFRNPVGVITKNHLITRDIDLLAPLAALECAQVFVSVTTLDAELTRILEPRTSVPRDRLRAIRELSAAGIPVGVLVAPVIPALTDHEMPAILAAAREAGAQSAGFVTLRLPFVVKDLFADWLERHRPERREKVLNRIRDLRGGRLNDPNMGTRMRGEGIWAEQFRQMFKLHQSRLGFNQNRMELSTAHFRVPPRPGGHVQGALFD